MWLVRGNVVLASLEVAEARAERRRGLVGRDGIEGALLLRPARSVHTLRMRFAIDVAHLDAGGTVLRVTTMKPWRVGVPVLAARSVVEAEAGSFARWEVRIGDVLEVKGAEHGPECA